MSENVTNVIKTLFAVWTAEAAAALQGHGDHMAELKQAMETDNGDVRITYSIRRNAIILEACVGNTFSELYQEQLVPMTAASPYQKIF